MQLSSEDMDIIQAAPLFSGVADDIMKSIADGKAVRNYEKGRILFQEGDIADHFFLILDGLVKLFRSSKTGQETIIGIFKKGEVFAECAAFKKTFFPVSAEMVSEGRLLRIDATDITVAIRKNPEIAFSMLASISMHQKALVDHIEQLKTHTGPKRVARFLLDSLSKANGSTIVDLPYKKSLIADNLGMKPESFSRALAKLRDVGVVTHGEQVSVLDVDALSAYYDGQIKSTAKMFCCQEPHAISPA
jgi:CRP-like cAMP-binding protein